MHEPGDDAQPGRDAEHIDDRPLRTAGTVALVAGAVGSMLTVLGAILWRLDHNGQPCPYEIVLLMLGVCGGAVLFGVLERLNRPTRQHIAQLRADLVEERRLRVADREQTAAHLRMVATQMAGLTESVATQMTALTELVGTLKPELDEHAKRERADGYFSGYAQSERDHLKPTGSTGEILHMPQRRNSPPKS